jgi:hypothetical protein
MIRFGSRPAFRVKEEPTFKPFARNGVVIHPTKCEECLGAGVVTYRSCRSHGSANCPCSTSYEDVCERPDCTEGLVDLDCCDCSLCEQIVADIERQDEVRRDQLAAKVGGQ